MIYSVTSKTSAMIGWSRLHLLALTLCQRNALNTGCSSLMTDEDAEVMLRPYIDETIERNRESRLMGFLLC